MAVKYLYKCNPLVAKAAGVSEFSRYRWPDGCFLLWENDLIAIDRERYFLDREGLLADLGVARMTDPQCAEDQRDPQIRLPEARLPQYRWEQPDYNAKEKEEVAAGAEVPAMDADGGQADAEEGESEEGGES